MAHRDRLANIEGEKTLDNYQQKPAQSVTFQK